MDKDTKQTKSPEVPAENPNRHGAPHHRHYVDDSQSPYNEAQQFPQSSGDRRHPSSEKSVQLPWGIPTDNLHPMTQPEGDLGAHERSHDLASPPPKKEKL
jgi:hypothetical protein